MDVTCKNNVVKYQSRWSVRTHKGPTSSNANILISEVDNKHFGKFWVDTQCSDPLPNIHYDKQFSCENADRIQTDGTDCTELLHSLPGWRLLHPNILVAHNGSKSSFCTQGWAKLSGEPPGPGTLPCIVLLQCIWYGLLVFCTLTGFYIYLVKDIYHKSSYFF